MNKAISLRTRVAIVIIILFSILTFMLSLLLGTLSAHELEEEKGNDLKDLAFQMAEQLDQYMWSRSNEIHLLKGLQVMEKPDNLEEIRQVIHQLKETFSAYSWIGYLNPEGDVIAASDDILVGENIAQRPVFIQGSKGTYIGDVHDALLLEALLPNPSGEKMKFVDISTPILDEEGTLQGILAAHLSWKWASEVERTIISPLLERRGVDLFVVSPIGNSVILGPQEAIGSRLDLESLDMAYEGQNYWRQEDWKDGADYIVGYALADGYENYSGLNWAVLVRQPIDQAFAQSDDLRRQVMYIGLVTTLIFGVIGWLSAGALVRPIAEITKATLDLQEGKEVTIPQQLGIKELDDLGRSIHDLVYSLGNTEVALEVMSEKANRDPLTGLYNRNALALHANKLLENQNAIGILYMDLDDFKRINDQYGHKYGDELLVVLSKRLKTLIRKDEIVARMGGDEFLVIIQSPKEKLHDHLTTVSRRILEALHEPIHIAKTHEQVFCSIGIYEWLEKEVSLDEAIHHADQALYMAKEQAGKGLIMFYNQSMEHIESRG